MKQKTTRKIALTAFATAMVLPAVVAPFAQADELTENQKLHKLEAGDTFNFSNHVWEVVTIATSGSIYAIQKDISFYGEDKTLYKDVYKTLLEKESEIISKPEDLAKLETKTWNHYIGWTVTPHTQKIGMLNETDWKNYASNLLNPEGKYWVGAVGYYVGEANPYRDTTGTVSKIEDSQGVGIRPAIYLKPEFRFTDVSNNLAVPTVVSPSSPQASEVGTNSVKLSWDKGLGADEYIVKRGGKQVYKGTELNFEDTNLVSNTKYTYEVYGVFSGIVLGAEPKTITVTTKSHLPSNISKMQKGEIIKFGIRDYIVLDIKEDGGAVIVSKDVLPEKAPWRSTYADVENPSPIYATLEGLLPKLVPDEEQQKWLKSVNFEVRSTTDVNAVEVTGTKTNDYTIISPANFTQRVGMLTLADYNKNKVVLGLTSESYATSTLDAKSFNMVYTVRPDGYIAKTRAGESYNMTQYGLRPVMHLKPEYSFKTKEGEAIELVTSPVPNFKLKSFGTTVRISWDSVPNAISYEITRNGLAKPIIVDKEVTTYDDSGLVNGLPYDYTIKALYEGGIKGEGVTKSTGDKEEPELPPTDGSGDQPSIELPTIWSFDKPDAPFVGVKPHVTVVGGKPSTGIVINNVEWSKNPVTVETGQGPIILESDGKGNTLLSVPNGLGTTSTDITVNVKSNGTHFLNITIKPKPVINFNLSF